MARSKQQARKNGGEKQGAAAKFTPQKQAKKAKAEAATGQQKRNRKPNLARQAMKAPAVHAGPSQTNGNANKAALPDQDPGHNKSPYDGLTQKQKQVKKAEFRAENEAIRTAQRAKRNARKKAARAARDEATAQKELKYSKKDPLYKPSDSGASQATKLAGSGEGDDEYEPPETQEVNRRVTRSQSFALPQRPAKSATAQSKQREGQVQVSRQNSQTQAGIPAQVSPLDQSSAVSMMRQGGLAVCDEWKQCWKSSTLVKTPGARNDDVGAIDTDTETDRANDQLQRELDQAAAPGNASSSTQHQTKRISQSTAPPLPKGSRKKSKQLSQEEISAEAERKKARKAEKKSRRMTSSEKKQKRRAKMEALIAAQDAEMATEHADPATAQVETGPPAALPPHRAAVLAQEEMRVQHNERRKPLQRAEGKVRKERNRAQEVAEALRYQELAEQGVVMATAELMEGRTTFPLDFWEDLAGTKMAAMSRGVGMYL